MLVGDGHIAKVAADDRRIIVASFDGGVVDAVCSHVAINQTLERGVVGGKTVLDVVDAADAGQASSRSHRGACEKLRMFHV